MLGVKHWSVQSTVIRIMDSRILQELGSGSDPGHFYNLFMLLRT